MKILSVVSKKFYGRSDAVEPMYLEFTEPLIEIGHEVEHFDHADLRRQIGLDGCGEQFVERVKTGCYDVVLYQTGGQDWMAREAIGEAKRYTPVIAWNSDDDWQWASYTRQMGPYFTFMVTTYPHIYEENKNAHPNIKLSQWACYDRFADFNRVKDLDFTFVGQVYTSRVRECSYLRSRAGLQVFGRYSARINFAWLDLPGIRRVVWRLLDYFDKAINFREVNDLWNRSRISYTPLKSGPDPKSLQIKSRVFEMGLSGTMMLCEYNPTLLQYYEPGKEFVTFQNLDDCADKAKYYLAHEDERARIAKAYHDRTKSEHLWQHRFKQLFNSLGLEK
jgi:spore maturation protein CgeB